MDYKKIIDQLTNEVLTYIQKAIQKAPADKSFRTKILDNLGDGKYKVRYKGKDYTVKANSSGLIVGTWVTVCALQNNWNELYILGTESGNSSSSELDSEHINDTSIHTNSTEKSKWNQAYSHSNSAHAPSNAQENVIETIEVNGSAVEVSDKTVNITVPTKTSELILDNIEEGANKYVHPDSGVAAGTYKQVVVNAQGHITSGSNPTTLSGYGITDAEAKGTASSLISTHNSSTTVHSDIRDLISGLETRLNTLADSDDETLDQMSEIVAYIKNNKSLIENITTSKVSVSDIVDNLTTNVSNKPLSAAQGIVLKELIDSLQKELNNNTDKINEELDGHIDDTTIHITSDERVNWNDANDKKHTHSNKSVLDGITSTLISTWNNVTNKLDKTGDASNVTNTITAASIRENLTTGEKLSTSLGKIAKWFSDLKTVAFSGSYNDLSDIPTIGNGTITIKQAGSSKGTFTLNQTGDVTIELTDNNTDTKVTNTLATTTKAYVTGTTSASTNTGTQVFDTGVYLDTTAGKLTATTFNGSLTGNADTATALATARTINGTSFNGSANITTANWGTARTLTIGLTGKSVNGSGNVSWSLSEIGAAESSHTHTLEQCGSVGYYGSDIAGTNGWYKVYSNTLTGYNDNVARLSLIYGYSNQNFGVLNLHIRCDNGSTVTVQTLKWETRMGFSADDVIIVTEGNVWSLYVYNRNTRYGRIKVRVLESTSTSSNWGMTLESNYTPEETDPTPTAVATDGATVNYANSAGSATKDSAGNTIISKYVTVDTEQVITGKKTFSNTTVSTSKDTGGVIVKGGLGVAGQISSDTVMVGDKCTLSYDSTNECLDFIFT